MTRLDTVLSYVSVNHSHLEVTGRDGVQTLLAHQSFVSRS